MVRLYLSSFRLGYHPEFLVRMAGQAARVAVVANAMDGQPRDIGRHAVERELAALSDCDSGRLSFTCAATPRTPPRPYAVDAVS